MSDTAALQARFQEALAAYQQGDLARAQGLYRDLLTHRPDDSEVLFLLGQAALQAQNFEDAATLFARLAAMHPDTPEVWFNHGMASLHLQQHAAAAESFGKVIALQPENHDAHNNRAIALRALGRHEEALAGYDAALVLRPNAPEAHNNRAVTLSELERHADAAAASGNAIALKPDYAEAHNNHGNALRMLRRYDAALASFTRAIALNPAYAAAYNNRGLTYADLYQYQAAVADYTRAIELNAHYAEAFGNRAICFADMNDPNAALADYRKATALNPQAAHIHVNVGHFLADIRRYAEALESYRTAQRLNPDAPFLEGYVLYMQLMNGNWEGMENARTVLQRRIGDGARAASPFPTLTLTDDPALQRKAAEIWGQPKYPAHATLPPTPDPASGGKIRVAYFSMDFRKHAIATLTAGLYEAHDRTAFEIYAFSYGPDTGDEMRARLERAFDTFIDVRTKSDTEVAALARSMRIDIAVDLAGYTKQARTGIFAWRAAPVQISYLGFPGTLALPYMDYIIADAVVIPPEAHAHYMEKAIFLPVFQVNDDKRARPTLDLSREDMGLPPAGFVFCSFNNSYKFTPEVFSAWMRILHRVEGSVLLLYADLESTAANLTREAIARGIPAERLVFGKQLDMSGYLARYKSADLFLDTLPYNAGTTAADALWMGLPVLTCAGRSFASRMAASLLHTVDLPELVTYDLQAYEDRAVALAKDPARLADMKSKLARTRAALFDTAAFTRNLERAYVRICERARAGLPPDHIAVLP